MLVVGRPTSAFKFRTNVAYHKVASNHVKFVRRMVDGPDLPTFTCFISKRDGGLPDTIVFYSYSQKAYHDERGEYWRLAFVMKTKGQAEQLQRLHFRFSVDIIQSIQNLRCRNRNKFPRIQRDTPSNLSYPRRFQLRYVSLSFPDLQVTSHLPTKKDREKQ